MKPTLLPLLALIPFALSSALAQTPTESVNRQDEILNFNQEISPNTDTIRVLRSDNQQTINDYVTEVFELRNAEAIEILPLVLDVVRVEGGTAQIVKLEDYVPGADADASLNRNSVSYLQVVAPSFQIPSIRQLVRTLDIKGVRSESGIRYNHLRLANRDAMEVAAVISSTVLSSVGSVSVDEMTNTIYIEDGVSDSERALITAAFYDVPPPQVELKVNIIEIEDNDDNVLGLEWDAWKETLTGGYIFEYGQGYNEPDTDAFLAGNAIISVGGDALARFLNYMKENGTADIVSRSTLTAINKKSAVFTNMTPLPNYRYEFENLKLGTLAQVRYDQEVINTAVLAAGGNGDPIAGVTNLMDSLGNTNADFLRMRERFEHQEGIVISMTPVIGTETITLKVDALLNSLVDETKQETPLISTRTIENTVNLKYGETFKLGSFERKHEVIDERGLPILKDIPYLGYLFKKEVTIRRDKKIVIFLTPELRSNAAYTGVRLDDRTVFSSQRAPNGDAVTGGSFNVIDANDQALLQNASDQLSKVAEDSALVTGEE